MRSIAITCARCFCLSDRGLLGRARPEVVRDRDPLAEALQTVDQKLQRVAQFMRIRTFILLDQLVVVSSA